MLTVTPDQLIIDLPRLLARVATGEEVAIIDHGDPVAHIVSDRARLRERLAGAVAAHEIELGTDDDIPMPPLIVTTGMSASQMLEQDRAERDASLWGKK